MRKRKRMLWIAVPIVVLILIFTIFVLRMGAEAAKHAPAETMEIVNGIYSILDENANVNLYLIQGDSGFIAIDAGVDLENVKHEFEKLALDPNKVNTVFLTHSDWDHTGGVSLFENASVFLSELEEPLINGQKKRMLFMGNRLNCDYLLFQPGQVFLLDGLKIECMPAPGHTPGSTWFLVDDRYLFVGDGMSLEDGRVDLFNKMFNMDSETQIESHKKLTSLSQLQYLFTGHYGYTDQIESVMGSVK